MSGLRIATFNIRHALGMDDRIDLGRIANVLRQINADIILLQEVEYCRPRSKCKRQAYELARKLDMEYAYGPVTTYRAGSYGNAILSRYPILKSINYILPDSPAKRGCLQADLTVKNMPLTVFNTHLGLNKKLRRQHIEEMILPRLLSISTPLILGGDFNARPESPEIILLSSYLADTFSKNSGLLSKTFPSINPVARIDYLFINQGLSTKDFFIMDSHASDHLPVIAEVDLA